MNAQNTFEHELNCVLAEIKIVLLSKNAAYGDSALSPLRIFSRADAIEQIKVRLDDKLSRLARGSNAGEDCELDLIGYLVLSRIARFRQIKELNTKSAASATRESEHHNNHSCRYSHKDCQRIFSKCIVKGLTNVVCPYSESEDTP